MKVSNLPLKIGGLLGFCAVCLVLFAFLFQQAGGHLFQGKTYNVTAIVPDAYNLVNNGDVKEDGVTIGYITGITNRGPYGKVAMAIQSQYAPLYRDAQVEVRTKTLVGENYMSIAYPGTPSAGVVANNGTLTLHNAISAVDLNQILDIFDPHTRSLVGADLRALGKAFDNRGADLNELFGALQPLTSDGGPVMQTLDAQRSQFARLIQYTGETMQAFANRTAQLQGLISSAKSTAVAVAARDTALSQSIDELPSTLDQARATATDLGTLSGQATPVIDNLDTASRLLAPVVQQLTPTTTQAQRLFAALPRLIHVANPLLSQLQRFSSVARPQIPALSTFLQKVDPALSFLAPYNADIGSFFANVGSAVQDHDKIGNLARVSAVVGPGSLDIFSPADLKILKALAAMGNVTSLVNANDNGYPRPGTSGDPQPSTGYQSLKPWPASR